MEPFVWSDRFLTGEPSVDEEHRSLVQTINRAASLIETNARPADVAAIVEDLVQYAVKHFANEDAIMAAAGCDERHLNGHRAAHGDFFAQVQAMRESIRDVSGVPDLVNFLASWLAYHILGMDQAMARQLRNIRAGMTPAEAYEREYSAGVDAVTAGLLGALDSLYRVVVARNTALSQANQRLEDAVAQRTQALKDANLKIEAEKCELESALAKVTETQQRLLESEAQRALDSQRHMQQLLAQIVDGSPIPTFVINAAGKVTHWNKACAATTRIRARDIIGTDRHWSAFYEESRPIMADLVVAGRLEDLHLHYEGIFRRSPIIDDAYEAEDFFPKFGESGRWLHFTASPIRNRNGQIVGAIETLEDITERRQAEESLLQYKNHLEDLVAERTKQLADANVQMAEDAARREAAEKELLARYAELTELNIRLSETKEQLVQSEKLASIGQLAAGVAHEINNPIGYVFSNVGALETYLRDLFRMLDAYESSECDYASDATRERLGQLRAAIDLDYLKTDIPALMSESKEGITRVKKIVQDLKDFSRVDTSHDWQMADLHKGIDSTINIVNNEIKYKADIVKDYGVLPEVECLPSQLNQVFMNLLVNAAHAMGEARGVISIRTGVAGESVWLEFSDTGAGIPPEIQAKVFDPFFTTKPIGKGTGLGLSLAYGIIQEHRGNISLKSEMGVGTTFRITLPIRRMRADA